jgi:L-alanine-DL-glutamate epimerase-like enolase superfamily enzyme
MSTRFDEHLANLALVVDDYTLERAEQQVSSAFLRVSTTIRLRGGGEEGIGEDVTYDAPDQDALQTAGPVQPLAGQWTLASFCDHVESLDLWPSPPEREPSILYRIWAYESAALDLALRQAGLSLHDALAMTPRPLTFVTSLRLGDPPTLEPVTRRLANHPTLRFKLDAVSAWDDELVAALAATGAVDSIDFKGLYEGSIVDQGADPELYQRVVDGLPDAWFEDPKLTPETDAILEPFRDQITWDANIHGIADIEGLAFPPRMVNIKPSRLGGLRPLLDAYEYCEARGIGMYGGGQFELGCGRGQIQYLASIFHPDTPNDVAPGGYNESDPAPGLPSSPLPVAAQPTGFRWG